MILSMFNAFFVGEEDIDQRLSVKRLWSWLQTKRQPDEWSGCL